MTQDEVELKIKEAIQSEKPVWLGVWLDIEKGDFPVWLTLGNKLEQPSQQEPEETLHYHAFNYRQAHTSQAHEFWLELEQFVDRKIKAAAIRARGQA